MEYVAVYCASSTQIKECYFEVARELGRLLAEHGLHLINGAGNMGLMQATSDACLAAGGKVTGIIPTFMVQRGWHHTGLTNLIELPDMQSRKKRMADMSDAAIALPGGCGTFEELFEILTWKQLGLYENPIIILNVDGYYDSLLDMLQHAIDEKFMRQEHSALWCVATTAQEAVELLYSTPRWDSSVERFGKH